MKKAVFAATLLFCSGTILAQSSVTLYGVADAGIASAKSEYDSSKVRMSSSSLMNNDDSYIGLTGVEDLGAGLEAGFNFESVLSLNNGDTEDEFWESQAHVWLAGNWGRLTLGRSDNPSAEGIEAWELTDDANYSVVNNTYNYVGGVDDGTDGMVDGDASSNSQFKYQTPEFSGLSATVSYIAKANNDDKQKWDMNVVYEQGPIAAGLSANKTKSEKAGYAIGGKYDFGTFEVAASYSDNHKKRRGFSLGGSTEIGAFSAVLDLTRDTRNRAGHKKYTNGLLEGQYALSKRTFLYAAYLRLDGDNNYGIGMQHAF